MCYACELEQYSFVQKYLNNGKLFWKEAYTCQYFPHVKPSVIRILVFHFICFHMSLTSKSSFCTKVIIRTKKMLKILYKSRLVCRITLLQ